jgi:hypothetical protein
MLKRFLLANLAVAVGLIAYNGHAGLGASAYQHNQTDPEFLAAASVSDGTSNTAMFGERAAREAEKIATGRLIPMADMGRQF